MRDERDELLGLARKIAKMASEKADVAEVSTSSSWDLSAKVRDGKTELIEEAGSRGVSLRVIVNDRLAMSSTSDLSENGLRLLVEDAVELAQLSEPDPLWGPASPEQIAKGPHAELDLFDSSIAQIDASDALERAKKAEAAAKNFDPRIVLSEGATFARTSGASALVLSSGFEGTKLGSYASLNVVPLAEEKDGKKRRGYFWTAKRHQEDLDDLQFVGEEAARRTLRKLGAEKIDTAELPVIFDSDSARSILGTLAGGLVGGALWRKSTWLMDKLEQEIASPLVSIVDDPLIKRGPGSRAWDGEGLKTQKRTIVDQGKLKGYFLDLYSSRKLGMDATGSASRGGGSIGASSSNLYLHPGTQTFDELIAKTDRALLVTEMMGFGYNGVTGDFSRGAGGFLIENGKISHPVNEVTISSDLLSMMLGIDGIADDLDLKTSTASPAFRVKRMTVSGN